VHGGGGYYPLTKLITCRNMLLRDRQGLTFSLYRGTAKWIAGWDGDGILVHQSVGRAF
jgi:hypothetical protein